jgi:hypothetical protein
VADTIRADETAAVPPPSPPTADGPARLIRVGNITAVPSFHCRAQFALEVRRAFRETAPDCIAVELAEALREPLLAGLKRLPSITVLSYPEVDGKTCYMSIDPCDSMIEASRLAVEHGLPLHLVDMDVDNYRQKPKRLPDEYAVGTIGLPAYTRLITADDAGLTRRSGRGSKDYDRERHMASRLRELSARHRSVLFVLGMAHWPRIEGFLRTGCKPPPDPALARTVTVANVTDASFPHVLGELPYVTYLYELARRAESGTPPPEAPASERPNSDEAAAPTAVPFDKAAALKRLITDAEVRHEKEWGERAGPGAMRTLLAYARKWAVSTGRLLPDLYQMVVGGKSVVSDTYAGELLDLAWTYPFNEKDPSLPTMDIRKDTGRMGGKTFAVRRKQPVGQGSGPTVTVRRPARREERDGWKGDWDRREKGWTSHCSHIPEDLVLEEFAAYVRKRALELLAAGRSRTLEFTSSLLDGLELRETIRNWHLRRKLFVREEVPVKGKVGPVVCVFEEDDDFRKYPWLVTWLSEFEYECDLALYATGPGEQLVGPGISRSEYGGFACITPAQRIRDVWSDPDFDRAVGKSERLLMAAIKYGRDPFIAYVGPRPPRPYLSGLAGRKGMRIIYVPPGALSPGAVAKVRRVHVLRGRDVRRYAKDYIR